MSAVHWVKPRTKTRSKNSSSGLTVSRWRSSGCSRSRHQRYVVGRSSTSWPSGSRTMIARPAISVSVQHLAAGSAARAAVAGMSSTLKDRCVSPGSVKSAALGLVALAVEVQELEHEPVALEVHGGHPHGWRDLQELRRRRVGYWQVAL